MNVTAQALTASDVGKHVSYNVGEDGFAGLLWSVEFRRVQMLPDDPSSVRLQVTVIVFGNLVRVTKPASHYSQVLPPDTPITITEGT